jgi:hypothetical protein
MDCFPIISLRSLLPKWVGPFFFQDNPSSVWGDLENGKLHELTYG